MTEEREIALTKAESYVNIAKNSLDRQIKLGLGYPKNFDVKGALSYTALKIMDSKYASQVSKVTIVDTMIRVAQKGLDPRKDQIYILPNKKGEIMLMDSYFGYEKLAYDIDAIEKGSVYADVVREGEKVVFHDHTLDHEKRIEAQDNEIVGAYAKVIISGKEIAQYMTAYQISKSWSKTNSLDRNYITEKRKGQYGDYDVQVADTNKIEKGKLTTFNKNQADFPEDMSKRTVIKNLLKPIIKSHAEPSVAAQYDMSEENETIIKEAEHIDDPLTLDEVGGDQSKEAEQVAKSEEVNGEENESENQNQENIPEDLPFDL